jgi:hypothetical protein
MNLVVCLLLSCKTTYLPLLLVVPLFRGEDRCQLVPAQARSRAKNKLPIDKDVSPSSWVAVRLKKKTPQKLPRKCTSHAFAELTLSF